MERLCKNKIFLLWILATILTTLVKRSNGDHKSRNDNTEYGENKENSISDDSAKENSKKDVDLVDLKYKYLKWKNHEIPFTISRKIPISMRKLISEAIDKWNKDFPDCIRFIKRTNERDYVRIKSGDMCHSEFGRMSGRQVIVVDEFTCGSVGGLLHELAHAAGLTHEHNRHDRDKYIEVLFLNIPYEWRDQYEIAEESVNDDLGPYDYYSIMHYRQKSPDRDMPAFKVLDKSVNATLIGHATGLSDIDKLKVKRLYCPNQIAKDNKGMDMDGNEV